MLLLSNRLRGGIMLEEKVFNTINRYDMVQEGDKIVVGVSGGPDSISILNILNNF